MTRRATAKEHLRALADLTTDGYTVAPDLNIRDCCERHDFAYRNNFTPAGLPITRREADRRLRDCIAAKGMGPWQYRLLPWVYWLFVRLFGGPAWKVD